MSERLSRCPFCWSEGRVHHDRSSEVPADWTWTVVCSDDECAAVGPVADTEARAIGLWNERV